MNEFAEVLTLAEARAVTRNLQSTYVHALDAGRTEEVVGQFAAEGRAEIAGRPVATGRDAIRELYAGLVPGGPQLHLVDNLRVDEIDADAIRSVSNFAMLVLAEGVWRCAATGRYDDIVGRDVDGRWCFRSKTTTFVVSSS